MTEITLTAEQMDLILSALLVCSACIAWCLGFLAHEMGAK
jgi:hypothetical protein